ncbi:MAG: metal-sulfur cluster assembly factor [Gemmatimonadota bacterium]
MSDPRNERSEPDTADAARGPAAESPPGPEGSAQEDDTKERIRQALRAVSDPELGINIVDLGLVYDIDVAGGSARVTMTLTSPGCPAGGEILSGARSAAQSVEGVEEAVVNLVWKPFWTPERIDPKVRAAMGF